MLCFATFSALFNKDSCFIELLTISNVKGDWDAEKVIDIPNKKVTFYLAIFVQNLILFVESDKIVFVG